MLTWCLNLKFFTRPQHRLEALFGHISKLRSTTGMCGFCFPPYVGYWLSVDGFNKNFAHMKFRIIDQTDGVQFSS